MFSGHFVWLFAEQIFAGVMNRQSTRMADTAIRRLLLKADFFFVKCFIKCSVVLVEAGIIVSSQIEVSFDISFAEIDRNFKYGYF